MPVVFGLIAYCLIGLAGVGLFSCCVFLAALFDSWRMAAAERAARRDKGRRIPVARIVK